MPDIFTVLQDDHREVMDLLRQLTAETDAERRRVLFDEVQEVLRTHSAFEVRSLFPEARRAAPDLADGPLGAMTTEHDAVEALLCAMETEDPGTDAWSAHCRDLLATLERHARHIENTVFRRARVALSGTAACRLAEDYERGRRR